MKKILMAFAALIALAACNSKQAAAPEAEDGNAAQEVAFTVAQNYFFKNNQQLPDNPKITTAEEFNKLFGMATTMGEGGKPTAIDFSKQFVLAIVQPVTDFATEINPLKVEEKGDTLFYTYGVKTGEKQSFSIQPVSIIILDKEYENKQVVLVDEQLATYGPAIDRYLVNEIGKHYTQGDYCVPVSAIVAIDDSNAEDVRVWGDYWVFNYNQVGDTLKCISGGSHPGLMHLKQAENGFGVTAFDPVEDGSQYLPTAQKIFGDKFDAFQALHSNDSKRESLRAGALADYVRKHGLKATLYQDFGWPAKELK